MNTLTAVVTLLMALAVASERLVEMVKGYIPFLSTQQPKPVDESKRKAILHLLGAAAGVLTSYLAMPAVVEALPNLDNTHDIRVILALGLLASGGSGLWNTVLTYLLAVKDLQRASLATVEKQQAAAGLRPLPQPADGLI